MKDDSVNKWRQALHCPYFTDIVSKALGRRFAAYGLVETPSVARRDHVLFCGRHGCIDLGYESEPMPPHRPVLFLSRPSPDEPHSSVESVPLWFLMPEDAPSRNYWRWTFGSEEELDLVLERAWAAIIVPYAIPVATDTDRLLEALSEFARYIAQSG